MLKIASETAVPLRTARLGPLQIETVLEDWGLCDPIRDVVALLLNARGATDPIAHLKTAIIRIREATRSLSAGAKPESFRRTGIDRGRDHLASDRVARAFGLSPHLAGALWELKWAAYSATPYEARTNLAEAEEYITSDIHQREVHGAPLGWRV